MIVPPQIAVITDEIAQSLDDVLAFARAERLDALEVRQIDGANFLSLPPAALRAAARRIADAGITVTALTTPLLKWPAPGQPFAMSGDQFGFDPLSRPAHEHFAAACDAAQIFGTRNLRIFSYLAHEGFALSELADDLGALLALAERHDLTLLLENEPVCNVRRLADLEAAAAAYPHPRLKLLLDIGNLFSMGERPESARLARLMPHVGYLHIKDFAAARRRHVALGEGDVPFADHLAACLAAIPGRRMTLSLETHVPDDRPGATRRSLAALRRMVEGVVG
jgi:sugar phosphate isomerase/epimerase